MLNFDQKDGSVNENVRASLSTSDCLLLGGGCPQPSADGVRVRQAKARRTGSFHAQNMYNG